MSGSDVKQLASSAFRPIFILPRCPLAALVQNCFDVELDAMPKPVTSDMDIKAKGGRITSSSKERIHLSDMTVFKNMERSLDDIDIERSVQTSRSSLHVPELRQIRLQITSVLS